MSSTSIIYPAHFLIIERIKDAWVFKYGTVFYNRHNIEMPEHDRERIYGVTKKQIVFDLFRIGCGKLGFYLANVRDKKYYYCGTEWDSLKAKLRELGIGRDDPMG